MKRRIAALTAALVAFPAVAFADPPESVTGHWAPPPLVVSDSGTCRPTCPPWAPTSRPPTSRRPSPPRP